MIRLALRVRLEDSELALAELLALAPAGVEEVELADGRVEYAVYGAAGELPQLPDVRASVGGAHVEVSTRELPDDWSERWKRFHRPILVEAADVGEALWRSDACSRRGSPVAGEDPGDAASGSPSAPAALHVRPPWEAPSARAGVYEIVIDPGQAFGTGAHATTSMCLELLLALAAQRSERGALLDVGCGSGVLAIAAAQLGFAPVLGVDHDAEALAATRANARANAVTLQVRRLDVRRESLPALAGAPAPVVLANLVRPLLLDLAGSLTHAPRHLIASGLLRGEADEVVAAFAERVGLRERVRREQGEWAAVWLCAAGC